MNRDTAKNRVEQMEKEWDTLNQVRLLCEFLTPIVRDAIASYAGEVNKVGRIELSVHTGITITINDACVRSKFSPKGFVNE